VLSHLTRLASGYTHLFDSQCGYTAASRRLSRPFAAGPVFPRYGYPNHLLVRLAAVGARVVDVPVRPVYGPTWRSGIRISRVLGHLACCSCAHSARVWAEALRAACGGPSSGRAASDVIGVLCTSYPRGPDDHAGSFVRTRVHALAAAGQAVEVIAAGAGSEWTEDRVRVFRVPAAELHRSSMPAVHPRLWRAAALEDARARGWKLGNSLRA